MKNLKFLSGKKYLAACTIALMLGGRANAQSNNQNDSIKTQIKESKRPILSFINFWDVFDAKVKLCSNMSPNNIRAVFAPVVTEQSFMSIDNKVTVGELATTMLQNWATEEMSPIIVNAYTYVDINTKFGKIYTKIGKFSELDYSPEFAQYMPVSFQLINMIDFAAGHYLPRAVVVGFQNGHTKTSIGYAEDSPGIKITGNGGVILTMESIIDKNWKMGGTVFIAQDRTSGEFQSIYNMPNKDIVLLQLLDIGVRPTVYVGYKHGFHNDVAVIALNGFYQSNDGMAGGGVSITHSKSGVYVSGGAIYHDPLRRTKPDSMPNEGYNKISPFLEIGINKTVYPWER